MSANTKLTVLVLLLCAAGVAMFGYRAVYRSFDPSTNMDAQLVPMGARVWIKGGNPYDPAAVATEWQAAGGAPESSPGSRGRLAMVYLPGAYVITAGIGALPVEAWRPVWNLLNTGLYLATIALVLSLARIRVGTLPGLTFIGCALLMAPAQTNIAIGQTGVLVCFAVVLSQVLWHRRAAHASGFALGVALVLKPQTAVPFFFHDLALMRWRALVTASLTAGVLMSAGLAMPLLRGLNPLPDWLLNVRHLAQVAANPFARESPAHQLINVGAMLHRFAGPDAQQLASLGGMLIATLLALAYLREAWRSRSDPQHPTTMLSHLSITAVLAMVFTYHRLYDATVLLLPLALAFAQRAAGHRHWWVTFALLLPFFVPLASIVSVLQERAAFIPTGIYENRWFVTAVMMHQNWCLLLLAAWLIGLRSSQRRSSLPAVRVPQPIDARTLRT